MTQMNFFYVIIHPSMKRWRESMQADHWFWPFSPVSEPLESSFVACFYCIYVLALSFLSHPITRCKTTLHVRAFRLLGISLFIGFSSLCQKRKEKKGRKEKKRCINKIVFNEERDTETYDHCFLQHESDQKNLDSYEMFDIRKALENAYFS